MSHLNEAASALSLIHTRSKRRVSTNGTAIPNSAVLTDCRLGIRAFGLAKLFAQTRAGMMNAGRYDSSRMLFRRAQNVIPGGIHVSGTPLVDLDRSPLYFERGAGSHIWDADGNEYIDFIMAYGPFLLGYAHPEVDDAAVRQLRCGNLLSLNHPLHVQFAEAVLQRFPNSDMALFFKTGSEATTAALRIARRVTGRRKIARAGYHGWHDWCTPEAEFVPAGLDRQIVLYDAMQPATLKTILNEQPGEFAAVIFSPEMVHPPNRARVVDLMESAADHGAVFIMDEVKTGLRAPGGLMQAYYNVKPQLTTLSKALGNGWPVAAVVGTRSVMSYAADLPLSATYHGETAAMGAALATLAVIERNNAAQYVDAAGQRFIDGLNAAARRNNVPTVAYGEPIPAMPFLEFAHPDPEKNERLKAMVYEEAIAAGILLHPRHLWYISTAHTQAEIDRAVETIDRAMHATISACPELGGNINAEPRTQLAVL